MAVEFEPGRPGAVKVSERHVVTVLSVDDSEARRRARRGVLESAGFHVIDASSAASAWELVVREAPDVVLLDVVLPDGDGFELTRRIKASLDSADIRIIQISSIFTDCEHRVRGLDSGADAYLIEPVDAAELRAVVHATARSRRTENLLKTLMDGAPMLIAGADSEGRIVVFNPACEAVTGFRREDLLGRPFIDALVCDEDRATVLERIQAGTPAALAMPHVERWKTATGGTCLIEWRCFSIPSPTGAEWVIGLGSEIADRRGTAPADEAREQLATALGSAGMGMWELDCTDGTCVWSGHTAQLFGLPAGSNAGSLEQFLELVHPDDRALVADAMQAALERGPYEVEFRTTWPDGSVHWISGRGKVTRESDGSQPRLIGIAQDITRHKRVAQQLQEVNQRKDAFISTVAHELRQPLTPMVAALELMKRRISRESGERARAVIERQTAQMQRLVDDMIDASRVAQGKVALDRKPLDVRDVVAHTCEMVQPLFDRRLQQFTVSMPEAPIPVVGDAGRLQQALANVLSNAAKYSDEGARIWLTVELQPGWVLLRVRDTGRGIEPHLMPTLFDFFIQGTPEVGGLGLGLAIVRRLVEAHGGTIEARSDGPGAGAEFVMRLPGGEIQDSDSEF